MRVKNSTAILVTALRPSETPQKPPQFRFQWVFGIQHRWRLSDHIRSAAEIGQYRLLQPQPCVVLHLFQPIDLCLLSQECDGLSTEMGVTRKALQLPVPLNACRSKMLWNRPDSAMRLMPSCRRSCWTNRASLAA